MNLLFLTALALQVEAPLPDAAALVRSLQAEQRVAQAKARAHEPVDLPGVEADVKAKAEAAVAGLDSTKLPPESADEWSALYRLAGRAPEATKLAEDSVRYLTMRTWSQQLELLQDYLAQGDKPKILHTLDTAASTQINMVGQVGEFVIFELAPKYRESDPKMVLSAFDVLLRRVNLDLPLAESDRAWRGFCYARLTAQRDLFVFQTGHPAEALADLRRTRAVVRNDARAVGAVDEILNQLSTTGKPAPEIVAERQIGAYKGLAALRGKVVLVDFFAHWCGPCKRAFPDMRALYADSRPKGLEVVGVTSLQGTYGDQQGVKPDAEFALMRDRFVPEFKLPWPIVFERGGAASKAYGVSGIPQLVVIDRAGRVRRIVVGYTPDEFRQTRALVAKLLAEPVPR